MQSLIRFDLFEVSETSSCSNQPVQLIWLKILTCVRKNMEKLERGLFEFGTYRV